MEQAELTPISKLGEFGLIERLTSRFQNRQMSTIKGVGDDAAVLGGGPVKTVVTTDLLLEGIHFDLSYTPLAHLGYKAIAVNLSDLCAMNVVPSQITVSLGISSRFTVEALDDLYHGIRHACQLHEVDLVGGDTSTSAGGLLISVTAIGFAPAEEIVYRSGARPGDLLCVSGDLGAAYLGLQLLEREKQIFLENPDVQPDLGKSDYLLRRILKPEPRTDVLRFFRDNLLQPTSMIDLSDGLSSDLLHLCRQSGTGVRLREADLPISEEARMQAFEFQLDPTLCALSGGEDYELLFTIDPDDESKIAGEEGISIIGQMESADHGCVLLSRGGNIYPITAQGWNHFRATNS